MEDLLIEEQDLRNIFGPFDSHIKIIEKAFGTTVVERDGAIRILGEVIPSQLTAGVLSELNELSKRGNTITEQQVRYSVEMQAENINDSLLSADETMICRTIAGKPVKPKTLGQKAYVDAIKKNMIVFGLGPAGTGKTYIAIALAVRALKNREIKRIILTRPAVEAGERLGFLPGDLKDKLDPYLQPLYDALEDMIPSRKLQEFMADGIIQIAPLAYMRGRTLDRACVILDEAQNTNIGQLKMFLTRMGTSAKFIVTGDATQIDLPRKSDSGLIQGINLLKGIKSIKTIMFSNDDIVRHPLVTKIVKAFDTVAESPQD